MTKGTSSQGKHNRHSHGICRRCGSRSYHLQKKTCASCGFPSARLRSYRWSLKRAQRSGFANSGRMRSLKKKLRVRSNGYRTGTTPATKRS